MKYVLISIFTLLSSMAYGARQSGLDVAVKCAQAIQRQNGVMLASLAGVKIPLQSDLLITAHSFRDVVKTALQDKKFLNYLSNKGIVDVSVRTPDGERIIPNFAQQMACISAVGVTSVVSSAPGVPFSPSTSPSFGMFDNLKGGIFSMDVDETCTLTCPPDPEGPCTFTCVMPRPR